MIVRGGENLSPGEIEDVLLTHPVVAEAVVLGLPDEEWGEVVAAVVVLHPGAAATPGELSDWVVARLRVVTPARRRRGAGRAAVQRHRQGPAPGRPGRAARPGPGDLTRPRRLVGDLASRQSEAGSFLVSLRTSRSSPSDRRV